MSLPMDTCNSMAEYVVISDPSSPSPESPPPRPTLDLSLLPQLPGESEVKRLARENAKVAERHSSMRRSLSENRSRLLRIKTMLSAKDEEIAAKDEEIAAKANEVKTLQNKNRLLKEESMKLQNKEEVWEQTRDDYNKLKNNYDLLTVTNGRLKCEIEDLVKTKQESVAAETARVKANLEEDFKKQLQAGESTWQEKLQTALNDHEAKMEELSLKMTAERKEAIDSLNQEIFRLTAALKSTLDKCQEELEAEKNNRTAEIDNLDKVYKENLQKIKDEQIKELIDLVAIHKENLLKQRADYDEKIQQQDALVVETRRQLEESASRHEAEKNDLLEQLRQHNLSSIGPLQQTQNLASLMEAEDSLVMCPRDQELQGPAVDRQGNGYIDQMQTMDSLSSQATFVDEDAAAAAAVEVRTPSVTVDISVGTEQSAGTCLYCQNPSFEAAQNRAPVQEHSSVQSAPLQVVLVDMAVGTECASVANSDASAKASIQMAESAMVASHEVQTDEIQLEFQVANAEHIQEESASIRNLRLQINRLAKELLSERTKSDRLEEERVLLSQERANLLSRLEDLKNSEAAELHKSALLEQKVMRQTEELLKKQSELDSILLDFDDSRNQLYKFVSETSDQKALLELGKEKSERLEQQIKELESRQQPAPSASGASEEVERLRQLLAKKQSECDSLIADLDETRNKLCTNSDELKELTCHLTARSEQLEKLRQKINELEATRQATSDKDQASECEQVSRLTKQLEDKKADFESLIKDLDETRNELLEVRAKSKEFESLLAANIQKAEKQGQKLSNFQANELRASANCFNPKCYASLAANCEQLDKQRQKITELEAELQTVSGADQADNLVQYVSQLKKQLKDKQADFESVINDLDETRCALYTARERVNELQTYRLAAGDETVGKPSQKINDLEAEQLQAASDTNQTKELQLQMSQLTKQLADKKAEYDYAKEELDHTRNELSEFRLKSREFQALSDASNAKTECQAQKLTELKAELQSAKSQQTVAASQCQDMELKMAGLTKQLEDKNSDCESLIKDLDETRHALNEAREKSNELATRLSTGEEGAEKLRQKIRELETEMEQEKAQLQMEQESKRKEEEFKATKLKSAEKEAEQLQQEVERLKKQIRENEETVQSMVASSEQECQKLKSECEAQKEALAANAKLLEEKAALELQLRDAINDLVEHLKRQAEETDQKILEENRKHDLLYNRMCDQSEQRAQAERQLQLVNKRLEITEHRLKEANDKLNISEEQLRDTEDKLHDSESYVAQLQKYSEEVSAQLQIARQSLQESVKKRDAALYIADQLRRRLDEEVSRSAGVNDELAALKQEHVNARASYSEMQQSVVRFLASEHQLKTDLEQKQQELKHNQHEIDQYKQYLQDKTGELNALRIERDKLQVTVNSLIRDVEKANQNQQDDLASSGFLGKHRKGGPSGN